MQDYHVTGRLFQSYETGAPTVTKRTFTLGTFAQPEPAAEYIAEYMAHNELLPGETLTVTCVEHVERDDPSTKEEWFDELCAKKRERHYTEDEVAEYRRDLERRYGSVTDEELRKARGL
jgi:hypothetical protein